MLRPAWTSCTSTRTAAPTAPKPCPWSRSSGGGRGDSRDVEAAPGPDPNHPARSLREEFRRARELYVAAKEQVKHQFNEASRGRPPDGETAEASHRHHRLDLPEPRRLPELGAAQELRRVHLPPQPQRAVLSLNLACPSASWTGSSSGSHRGLLHDLGKCSCPRPDPEAGRLEPGEYEAVKTHSFTAPN